MYDVVNRNIVKFVQLCDSYCNLGQRTEQIEERSGIRLDLLKKIIYLEMTETNLPGFPYNSPDEKIDELLLEDFVSFYSRDENLVKIVGYSGEEEISLANNYYVWSVFQYTYMMNRIDCKVRDQFLWISILLPYMYKKSKYNELNTNLICQMVKEYPMFFMECNNSDALQSYLGVIERIRQKPLREYLNKILREINSLQDNFPERGEIDCMLDDAEDGLATFLYYCKKEKIDD